MSFSITQAMTFVYVVEQGSFTAAADRMGVSKSVVSKHITALESALETQLLTRSTRQLHVTEAGRLFYEALKPIPEAMSAAEASVQAFTARPAGKLTVIAPEPFGRSLTQGVVKRFLADNPSVSLSLHLVEEVNAHFSDSFDLMILGKLSHERFSAHNLVVKKLFHMPVGVYATASYLKAHGVPQSPHDLVTHNTLSVIGPRWPFKNKTGGLYSVEVSGQLDTKNSMMIREYVLAGQAITYAYPFLFEQALKEKKVVSLLHEHLYIMAEVYVAYRPTAHLPIKTRHFIDRLSQHYERIQQDILRYGG